MLFGRVETLLHMLQPCHKLAYILLVTGPLGQGTLQLTIDLKSKNKSDSITVVDTVNEPNSKYQVASRPPWYIV